MIVQQEQNDILVASYGRRHKGGSTIFSHGVHSRAVQEKQTRNVEVALLGRDVQWASAISSVLVDVCSLCNGSIHYLHIAKECELHQRLFGAYIHKRRWE